MISFAKKVVIDDELKALVAYSGDVQVGELVTHEVIAGIAGIEKDSAKWAKLIGAWRKWAMQERRQLLVSIRGAGYQFATPLQQIEHAERMQRQGIRRARIGGVVAGVIDPQELTAGARELQQNLVEFGERSRDMLNAAVAERKALLSRHESLPRIEMSGIR